MVKKNNIELLFTSQGCLSAEAIRRYLSGELTAEELEGIDQHASGCKLCRSALEGGLLFEDAPQYSNGLEKMQRKWNRKTIKEPVLSKAAVAGILSVAASLIILIGLHLIIQGQRTQRAGYIASRIFGGENISESIESEGLLLVSVSGKDGIRESVRQEELRKDFINSQDSRKSEPKYAMLGEIHVYADEGRHEADLDAGSTESTERLATCLKYPLKAVAMISPALDANVTSNEEIPEGYQPVPQLDKESIDLFRNFIVKNVRYPLAAKERRVGCRVYVQFAINKEGSLIDPVILNSCSSMFDTELLRVLRESPLWRPGVQEGRPVDVALVMPVEFRPD